VATCNVSNAKKLTTPAKNNLQLPSDAVRKQQKNILEDLFKSVLSQFKKINITPLKASNLII